MRIEQIMRHNPTRVGESEPVSRLIEWYANPAGHSRYSYVVDGEGKLLGIVTMMELLSLFVEPEIVTAQEKAAISDAEAMRRISLALETKKNLPVSRIMRKDLPTVAPTGLFLEARLLLRQRAITALPVVDENGILVGEITRRLIVKLLDTMLRDPDLFTLKKDCKRLFETSSEFFLG